MGAVLDSGPTYSQYLTPVPTKESPIRKPGENEQKVIKTGLGKHRRKLTDFLAGSYPKLRMEKHSFPDRPPKKSYCIPALGDALVVSYLVYRELSVINQDGGKFRRPLG